MPLRVRCSPVSQFPRVEAHLRSQVPPGMLPSTCVMLLGLPLAPGGDIDRAGLRLIATAQGRPERFWAVEEIRAPDGPGPGHWP